MSKILNFDSDALDLMLQGRSIKSIVCHHSASDKSTTVEQIDSWHKARGWSGVGYHIVIRYDGTRWVAETARNLDSIGAHTFGHNSGTIGICVCGDYSKTEIEPEALDQLILCLEWLCKGLGLDSRSVFGHKECEPEGYTECPGYDMDRVRSLLDLTLST